MGHVNAHTNKHWKARNTVCCQFWTFDSYYITNCWRVLSLVISEASANLELLGILGWWQLALQRAHQPGVLAVSTNKPDHLHKPYSS